MALQINPNIIFFKKGDQCKIFETHQHLVYNINHTAYEILTLCNGHNDKNDIVNRICRKYQENKAKVKKDIDNLLSRLLVSKIVTVESPTKKKYVKPNIDSWYISLENRCNLRCKFCYVSPVLIRRNKPLLNGGYWQSILFQILLLSKNNKPKLFFTGGEPLLHPDFFNIIRFAHKLGFKIAVFTNGTLINDRIAALFKNIQPISITISVDGVTARIHDSLRGVRGAFARTMKATDLLVKYCKESEIAWQTTINKQNSDNREALVDLAIKKGVSNLRIGTLDKLGYGLYTNNMDLNYRQTAQLWLEIRRLRIKYGDYIKINSPLFHNNTAGWVNPLSQIISGICRIGQLRHITADGYLTICPGFITETFKHGPVTPDNFHSLMEDKQLNYYKDFDVSRCVPCNECGYRHLCLGGCRAQAYYTTKNMNGCDVRRKKIIEAYLDFIINAK